MTTQYNINWRVAQYHDAGSKPVTQGMVGFLDFLRGAVLNCSHTVKMFYSNINECSGAIMFPQGMITMPNISTLSNDWLIYKTPLYTNSSDAFENLASFLNNNLTEAQACYGKSIASQSGVKCGKSENYVYASFLYRELDGESKKIDNVKFLPQKEAVTSFSTQNSVWDLHYFAQKSPDSIANSLVLSMDSLFGPTLACAKIFAADYYYYASNCDSRYSLQEAYGGVITARNLYYMPSQENLTNIWSAFQDYGSMQSMFDNLNNFFSNLTDAQICYGELAVNSDKIGRYSEATGGIAFFYRDLIGDSAAADKQVDNDEETFG